MGNGAAILVHSTRGIQIRAFSYFQHERFLAARVLPHCLPMRCPCAGFLLAAFCDVRQRAAPALVLLAVHSFFRGFKYCKCLRHMFPYPYRHSAAHERWGFFTRTLHNSPSLETLGLGRRNNSQHSAAHMHRRKLAQGLEIPKRSAVRKRNYCLVLRGTAESVILR